MLQPGTPAFPRHLVTRWLCRCGSNSLDEFCPICHQAVCRDCATFVDPRTHRAARPSTLLSERLGQDIMAHRYCLEEDDAFNATWIYQNDVELLLSILKSHGVGSERPSAPNG